MDLNCRAPQGLETLAQQCLVFLVQDEFRGMPPNYSQSMHTVQNRSPENTPNCPKSTFPYKMKPGFSVYAVPSAFLFLAEVFFPPFLALLPYFASSWAKKLSISFSRSLLRLWGGGKEHQPNSNLL